LSGLIRKYGGAYLAYQVRWRRTPKSISPAPSLKIK
jgi:hypothetical protein